MEQKPYVSGYIFMDWKFPESMKDFDHTVLNSGFIEADIPSMILVEPEIILSNRVFIATYKEFEKLPIYNFHLKWAQLMLDDWDNRFKYYATLKYWTTLEDGITIQYMETYKNVYPLEIPDSVFGHNISRIDSVDLRIPYHVEFTKYNLKNLKKD